MVFSGTNLTWYLSFFHAVCNFYDENSVNFIVDDLESFVPGSKNHEKMIEFWYKFQEYPIFSTVTHKNSMVNPIRRDNFRVRDIITISIGMENSFPTFFKSIQKYYETAKSIIWLVLWEKSNSTQTDIANHFNNTKIPFGFVVGILWRISENHVQLLEIYQIVENGTFQMTLIIDWMDDRPKFITPHKELYQRRSNLNGTVLKVAIFEEFPFVFRLLGKEKIIGFLILLWEALEEGLNFRTEYVMNYDNIKISSNTEVKSLVKNNKVHVGLQKLTKISNEDDFDYTEPYYILGYKLILRDSSLINWKIFISPFTTDAWISILVFIIVSGLLLYFVRSIHNRYDRQENQDNENSVSFQIINTFGLLCQQGINMDTQLYSYRFVYLGILLTSITVIAAYSAGLISSFAVTLSKTSINSLDELIRNKKYQVAILRDSDDYYLMKNSPQAVFQKIFENLLLPEDELPSAVGEAFDNVCQKENYAFITDTFTYDTLVLENICKTSAITLPILLYLRLSVNKNFPYKDLFEKKLEILRESGALDRVLQEQFQYTPRSFDTKNEQFSQFGYDKMLLIFYIWIVAIGLSVAILICEKVYFEVQKFRTNRKEVKTI